MGNERMSQLCQRLATDPTLCQVLSEGGISEQCWDTLYQAVSGGHSVEHVSEALDRIDQIADQLGLEPVTSSTREYRPLPGTSAGFRSMVAWRCPHEHRCGRVQLGGTAAPVCGMTGEPLTCVTVTGG